MALKLNCPYPITVTREDANFDRACDTAYKIALSMFEFDDYGHCKVPGYDRSEHSLTVEFWDYTILGNMTGVSHIYKFRTWVNKPK